MRDAIVFNGASNLDFQEIRTNVIRIPEVVVRIREAQEIWDKVSAMSLDLANFIASEDGVFLSHIKLKGFAMAVVQVGLLDRYLKSHKLAEFIIGAVNGDSPLQVALGKLTFYDMVAKSPALLGTANKPPTVTSALDLPVLAGVQLAEYGVFRKSEVTNDFERIKNDTREVERMIIDLIDDHNVCKLIMVGPGNSVFGKKVMDFTDRDVQVLESIDLDPMLSWFWSHLKENRLAIAN